MKRIIAAILITLSFATLLFTGCGKYNSSYSAVGFVHSNTSDKASMNFFEFDGTVVYKLKAKSDSNKLKYSAKLGAGAASVYYDRNGEKVELFSITQDSAIDEETPQYVELNTGTVYIIVETDGKCQNGTFEFEIVSE